MSVHSPSPGPRPGGAFLHSGSFRGSSELSFSLNEAASAPRLDYRVVIL